LLVDRFEEWKSPEAGADVWPTPRELLGLRKWLLSDLKLLETTIVKLASAATDVFGVSGRLMFAAPVNENAPQEAAEVAKGALCKKVPELGPALEGKLEEHHRFVLLLQRHDAAERDLAILEQRIQEKLQPWTHALIASQPGSCLLVRSLHSQAPAFLGLICHQGCFLGTSASYRLLNYTTASDIRLFADLGGGPRQ
jgi:hypothetical protein